MRNKSLTNNLPQTNGQTEMVNQTLISVPKILTNQHKTQWRNQINKLVYAYNSTKHATNGFTPYYLLFGWSPRLKTDMIMPIATETSTSPSNYVQNWYEQMKEAYGLSFQHSHDRKANYISKNNTKRPC